MGYGNANMRHAAEERKSMVMQVAASNDSLLSFFHTQRHNIATSFIRLL